VAGVLKFIRRPKMKTITISDETYEKIKEQVEKDKKQAKPEIRHGDYGLNAEEGWIRECDKVCWENGRSGLGDKHFISSKVGNLFDELKDMDGEMREFKAGQCSGIVASIHDSDNSIGIAIGETSRGLTRPVARRFARAILVLCANAERSGK
jgi:hypothetical protein